MTESNSSKEPARAAGLLAAHDKAIALLGIIECEMIRQDVSESALSEEICRLAADSFRMTSHSHTHFGPNYSGTSVATP